MDAIEMLLAGVATATAIANIVVAMVAYRTAKLAQREFELTKRPVIGFFNLTTTPLPPPNDSLFTVLPGATLKEVNGIKTHVHSMRYRHERVRVGGSPPGIKINQSPWESVVMEMDKTILYKDTWTQKIHFGMVDFERSVTPGITVATVKVEYEVSAEGNTRYERWLASFTLRLRGTDEDGVPQCTVDEHAPPQYCGHGKRYSGLRKEWQKWKEEMEAHG